MPRRRGSKALHKEAFDLAFAAGEAIAKATPEGSGRREAVARLYDLCSWIDKQFGWGIDATKPRR
jgi:hypothetical protein